MAGIYIHIPFCRKACHYCNFHFSTTRRDIDRMNRSIRAEASMRSCYINERVNTIYFGGGTPSLLPAVEISGMLDHLRELFAVAPDAEITLESNPDDVDPVSLAGWRSAGVNRLSIGIQSFFDEDLQWMNRAHDVRQARESVRLAREAGFENLTIDLIYGTPHLTDEKWRRNVETALEMSIPHLSCYALTVEPKTALDKMILQGKKEPVDVGQQGRQFELLMRWMEEAGYEHYEISNFALPGHRSRHNSAYWAGSTYLGLGPGAHSFDGGSRQWNIANNALYMKRIEEGMQSFEREVLSERQRLNEYVMTSLRTSEGLSLERVRREWNEGTAETLVTLSGKYISEALMKFDKDRLVLTAKGKLFADGIAADLFDV